jgi:hypothetical protein
MHSVLSRWPRLVLTGILLSFFGGQEVFAQSPRGQYPQSQGGGEGPQRAQAQVQAQENEPFIHGITIGAGLAIYQGDFSRNPNNNIIKYIAGSGRLSFRVGADHRLGQYDQYGLGADLVYNRLSGESSGGTGFSANSVALDFYADYELPYIREGLFRVFVGGGPNFIISPSYDGFPDENDEDNFEKLGTRVSASAKVGVTIMDSFRIGTRIASSDLLDGYEGFTSDGVPDFVSFLNVSYRFNLK